MSIRQFIIFSFFILSFTVPFAFASAETVWTNAPIGPVYHLSDEDIHQTVVMNLPANITFDRIRVYGDGLIMSTDHGPGAKIFWYDIEGNLVDTSLDWCTVDSGDNWGIYQACGFGIGPVIQTGQIRRMQYAHYDYASSTYVTAPTYGFLYYKDGLSESSITKAPYMEFCMTTCGEPFNFPDGELTDYPWARIKSPSNGANVSAQVTISSEYNTGTTTPTHAVMTINSNYLSYAPIVASTTQSGINVFPPQVLNIPEDSATEVTLTVYDGATVIVQSTPVTFYRNAPTTDLDVVCQNDGSTIDLAYGACRIAMWALVPPPDFPMISDSWGDSYPIVATAYDAYSIREDALSAIATSSDDDVTLSVNLASSTNGAVGQIDIFDFNEITSAFSPEFKQNVRSIILFGSVLAFAMMIYMSTIGMFTVSNDNRWSNRV